MAKTARFLNVKTGVVTLEEDKEVRIEKPPNKTFPEELEELKARVATLEAK